MSFFVVVVVAFALVLSPTLRCAVCHPLAVIVNGIRDLKNYICHKEFNTLHCGQLVAYTGLFGKGKTLSAVHRIITEFNKFNGKMVWCPRRKALFPQRVLVFSNVNLNIPYVPLVGLGQIVEATKQVQEYDDTFNVVTRILVLGDEFSVQLNSRNFKNNIDPLFLNTLLTCRHYSLSIYYTAQRFSHVDALLRQVTSDVVECNKLWRFQRLSTYDAWDMENAQNPRLCTPIRRSCWFVKNSDYAAYDTYACVGNLTKSVESGDMLNEDEILGKLFIDSGAMDKVSNPSRTYVKKQRKIHKK